MNKASVMCSINLSAKLTSLREIQNIAPQNRFFTAALVLSCCYLRILVIAIKGRLNSVLHHIGYAKVELLVDTAFTAFINALSE